MVSAGVDVDEAAQRLIEEGVDVGMLAEIEGFVRELDLDPSACDRTRLLVERTRLLVERATASAQASDRLRAEGRTATSDAAAGLSGLAGLLRHELATPLAIAEMALETLAARRDEPATMERMVEVARRNLRLANHLVHGLSSVEDLQAGRAELSRTQVDLAALVRECIEDVEGVLVGEHGIDVDVEQIVEAPADRDAVRQVLVNLLTNAAKFSPNGSRIKVTVSATPEYAEVGVRGQGPGLSPQDAERIFEAGQGLDPAVPGMGLGLFVARQLARAHGGDLRLQHPDAGGTRFVLRLPRSPAEWQSSLERREDAATARDTDHRQRTATADARDVTLGQRETTADQRDVTLVEREAVAEGRDTEASAPSDREFGSDPAAGFTSTEQHRSVANPVTYTWEALAGPLSMVAMKLRSLRSRQTTNSSEAGELNALIVEIDRAFSMVMRPHATAIHDGSAPDRPPSSTRPNTGR